LIQWARAHIPPVHLPGFVDSWKLATQKIKAAQVGWEVAGHRGELPSVPEVGVGRKKQRDERETTDPGGCRDWCGTRQGGGVADGCG
jgi:hypothetical protein